MCVCVCVCYQETGRIEQNECQWAKEVKCVYVWEGGKKCVYVCVTSRQTEQIERFNGGEREGVCMCMWIYPVASLVEKVSRSPNVVWCYITNHQLR